MNLDSAFWDSALWFAGFVAIAAIVGLLLYRRVWRTLPFFCVYSVWTLLGIPVAYVVRRSFPAAYFTTFFIEEAGDSALQFCVLVELAWSTFRPLRASLSRRTVLALGIVVAGAGAAIWPFANSPSFAHLPQRWHLLLQLQQTVSILRVAFFLILAGSSQLLSIGWRDRELQVAGGLGFYSLVSLGVAMAHTHQKIGPQYQKLDQLLVASYVCSLVYWIVCFAQKEAERREFTPQMQGMLLAVAGAARTTRVGLRTSESAKAGKR